MKQFHGHSAILGAAAYVFITAQPAVAQMAQVTGVKLNQANGGVSVVLQTSSSSRPQVFTTQRGNALVADIINAQLRLPQGNNFRQDNPAPGIASVEVIPLDANSIRVMVTGDGNIPTNQPVVRQGNELTLAFTPSASTATTGTPATTAQRTPEVMVPNPKITIDGRPAPPTGISQPQNQAPPFLPRAVAPPVGDIAISATDASPTTIDLGTNERVPRLVLRDAPVREVLSLLARAAGMNLAYVGGEDDEQQQTTGGGDEARTIIFQRISLDIENEPVQDVFNYVLRMSGLEASRSGRTIFVGPRLPNSTRDVAMRTLRLNQVSVSSALNFLVALGAESAVIQERLITTTRTTTVGEPGEGGSRETESVSGEETNVQTRRAEFKDSVPLLRGLQALGDERTNSITLVGVPRLIDIAVSQLVPLDIRRRQVAVNVRIIDVNLLNTQDQNTSFSFGIGNNFFVNDDGAATLNFGGVRPATGAEARNSLTETPIVTNPFAGGNFQFPKRLLASLQAQITNGNAKILTDPTLIVQEGQEAIVNLTQEVIGRTTVNFVDTPGGSREVRTTEEKEVGLTMNVKVDRIDDNGFISLSVSPSVSAPQREVDTGNGRLTLVSNRSLTSGTIRLRDGQTLILSGIIQDTDRTTVSKVPILGDIPLLGSLFRRTNRQNERNEVIVLLTPQILDDSENSGFGYNYTPSPQVRQMLERRGLNAPRR